MSYTTRTTCRLCDAPLPDERVLDLGETPLANALLDIPRCDVSWQDGRAAGVNYRGPAEFTAPLYLKQCTQCGHVQLPVVVDPKLLFPADYPYASATGQAMREHLDAMAVELERGIIQDYYAPPPLVVEIGSNDGYLLGQFRRHGCRTVGVDPAANLAAVANENGSLTIADFFSPRVARAIVNACGSADLVVANNVFAHADDLSSIVDGVGVLLGESLGRFVFEVGYLPDVLASNNFGTVYHEHLSYHTLRPLIDFFARHELGLYDAHRVDTQGGSIRCYVRRGPVETPRRLFDLVEAEASLDLTGWRSRVNFSAGVLEAKLMGLKSQGKSIAGYGCSAKSTTLLHVAGIGRETIDFICDDAPTKQGKFSPGKHIPIVHPDELEKRQPDYCVSLSGNFSEAFKARHPGYRGQWIEPDLSGQSVAA